MTFPVGETKQKKKHTIYSYGTTMNGVVIDMQVYILLLAITAVIKLLVLLLTCKVKF